MKHQQLAKDVAGRNRVTNKVKVVESSEDRLVIRGWRTSDVLAIISVVALLGVAAALAGFVQNPSPAFAAVMLLMTFSFLGVLLVGSSYRRSVEIEWRTDHHGTYRAAGEHSLLVDGRALSGQDLRRIHLRHQTDEAGGKAWTVHLLCGESVLEAFPPYLGDVENLRVVLRTLANRARVELIED